MRPARSSQAARSGKAARARVTARYDAYVADYRRYWAPVLRVFSQPLLARLPLHEGARLLDLGCGPAMLAGDLAARGARVHGVDLSLGMLRSARIPAAAGDIERLPFAGARFDAVVSTFVLQHVTRAGAVLREAARVLRPGGLLGTATWGPNAQEDGGPWPVVWRALDEAGAGPDPDPIEAWHDRVDSTAKMRRKARAAGFEILEAWGDRLAFDWTAEAFAGYALVHGIVARRLGTLDPEAQLAVRARVHRDVVALPREHLRWDADVVSLVARKP